MPAAMILGAGLGTRLAPLTHWAPKPMVPIGDRPAVAHVEGALRRRGIDRVVVNVHHRPASLEAWARAADVAVSPEEVLLGTAGGLAHAARFFADGEDVVVWNGDILADDGLALPERTGEATLLVRPRAAREGNVGLAGGRVVRLRKEAFADEEEGGDFLGIHVVGPDLRRELPPCGCLVGDVYLPALRRGRLLTAQRTGAPFVDVGSIASYVAANRAWLGAREAWVAPDAKVTEARGSVVGAGARVGRAIDSIVWPGTVLEHDVERAIATPHGVVTI